MTDKARIDAMVALWEESTARGSELTAEELCSERPELLETLQQVMTERRSGATRGPASALFRPGDEPTTDAWDPGLTTEGLFDCLRPPEGPEELGRLGPYRVVKLLGAGGMGAVFQAVDEQLGRSVALKVMRPGLAAGDAGRQRFVREARAAAALEHDHIVTVFHVGEDRGYPFLVMPLLHGRTLDDRLRDAGRLPMSEVLRVGREVAEGLAAAHARGLVHRDIKPANVWLEGERGRVKILDFGLALVADEAQARLTQDGIIVGTPAYMAPEQVTGMRDVDHRCDLYGLGGLLYRMTTGRAPFTGGGTAALLLSLVREAPVPPRRLNPEVPEALDALVMRLLAKDPDARPASARAAAEALRALEAPPAGDEPALKLGIRVEEPTPGKARARPARRRLGPALGALVLVGGLVAAAASSPWWLDLAGDSGRVVLVSPSPFARVAVKRGGFLVALLDPRDKPSVRLKAGSYDLELVGASGLKLAADRLELPRGGRTVIRVVPAGPAPSEPLVSVTPWAIVPPDDALPGLVPRPRHLEGLGRWQLETRRPRMAVVSLSWSPDRRRLACAVENDRLIRIYDADRLDLVGLFAGHTSAVTAVTWSPDGRHLASAGADHTVRLWDSGGTPGPVLEGHTALVRDVCWSPDGRRLASAGYDLTVRLWDLDGAPGPVLEGHTAIVVAVSWSPDGRHLASAGFDQTVRLWGADGSDGPVLKGHAHSNVTAVCWSPDGRRLASAGYDCTVRLWGADGTRGPVLEGKDGPLFAVSWSPDGRRIASSGAQGSVHLWGADGVLGPVLAKGVGSITALAWCPDSTRLATGLPDGSVRIWKADGTPTLSLEGWYRPVTAVTWSPDGRRLVSGSRDGSVRFWGADGAPGAILKGHTLAVTAVAWSPDGRHLASAATDRTVRLWGADGTPGPVLKGHTGPYVNAVCWSPDGRRLASAGDDSTVRLWGADGTPGPVLEGHTGSVTAVSWNPDGASLVSSAHDSTVRQWKLDGAPVTTLFRFPGYHEQYCVGWSPDGRWLALGMANQFQLVRAADLRPLPSLDFGGVYVYSVSWHPDSARFASGIGRGRVGTVRLWDVNGNAGPVLKGPGADVHAVAWSADGEHLAAGCDDGTLCVWRTRTLEPEWVSLRVSPSEALVLDGSGHVLRAPPWVEKELVYLVERAGGRVELLTPPSSEPGRTAPSDPVRTESQLDRDHCRWLRSSLHPFSPTRTRRPDGPGVVRDRRPAPP